VGISSNAAIFLLLATLIGSFFNIPIGGAGTFDGIFLTGILAVLLASLYARQRATQAG
jgi:uncharacterized membrane protein